MNAMLEELTEPASEPETPDALFFLAGFCWKAQRYKIWTLHYDKSIKRFTFKPAGVWGRIARNQFVVIGDELKEAKRRVAQLLKAKSMLGSGHFDMEPFDVLVSMIADPAFDSIGGYPQMVKVYKSLNTVPFVVQWSGKSTFLGRPLLAYEQADRYPRHVVNITR